MHVLTLFVPVLSRSTIVWTQLVYVVMQQDKGDAPYLQRVLLHQVVHLHKKSHTSDKAKRRAHKGPNEHEQPSKSATQTPEAAQTILLMTHFTASSRCRGLPHQQDAPLVGRHLCPQVRQVVPDVTGAHAPWNTQVPGGLQQADDLRLLMRVGGANWATWAQLETPANRRTGTTADAAHWGPT